MFIYSLVVFNLPTLKVLNKQQNLVQKPYQHKKKCKTGNYRKSWFPKVGQPVKTGSGRLSC